MDCKVGVEPNLASVFAQKPRSNAMECPRPGKRIAHYTVVGADHLPAYSFDAAGHLGCRPARECHQQNAVRVRAVNDEVGNAMCERVGLARACSGDDKQRSSQLAFAVPNAVFDGSTLFGIKFSQGTRWTLGYQPRSPGVSPPLLRRRLGLVPANVLNVVSVRIRKHKTKIKPKTKAPNR